ncbi:fructosyl peptide oxidase [Sporothrix brasiliensis 5110]|uniref:Fructosyl peptide oxidase n=1 Tax=Sporothrix brasiliensis 5110 TaxID=1398154 RepID=A0A0C2INC4_9PEZI|nr:fructosyl peptide oxidase [Sporothrix brasiliensis 5110]KIH90531.1 fructosyl peptide oxidase [Sporothrix brasiliensis 5110]
MTIDKPHVVVVGAGIVGASIAWHLAARHGQTVTVTVVAPDMDRGGTATPNSFAWLNANFDNARPYFDVRHRSMAHWKDLISAVPGLAELARWNGTVQWQQDEADLARCIEQHARWGYPAARITNAEVLRREPWLADAGLPAWGWAAALPGEGSMEPARAARAMVADARAHGAAVREATVERLLLEGDRVVGVVLPSGHGSIEGPHMRQTVEGRVIAGRHYSGDSPTADPDAEAHVFFSNVQAMFRSELDGVPCPPLELDFYTVGHRPDPDDGLSILGDSGTPGLTLAVMHSGVTLAAFVGQTLADLVATGTRDKASEQFSLSRFKV